jgi:hypothetical protein
MFGFIKNLIGGIFGFITGFLKKKDNSYYLELKEEATKTKPTEAKPVAIAVTAEPTPAPAATAKAKPAKASKKEAAIAPAAKAEPAKAPVPTETTFAPKYLVPSSSNGRRRPGANMNAYLDMARQVKTPG